MATRNTSNRLNVDVKTPQIKRALPYFLIGLLFSALIAIIVISENGLLDLMNIHQEVNRLKQINTKLQKEIEGLERIIARLENEDPDLIEKVARDEMKMIGKDEYILQWQGVPEDKE